MRCLSSKFYKDNDQIMKNKKIVQLLKKLNQNLSIVIEWGAKELNTSALLLRIVLLINKKERVLINL